MARTITEIKKEITDLFIQNPDIITTYDLQPNQTFEQQFSKAGVESILFYNQAYSINVLEQIIDSYREEIESIIANLKPHSRLWYINMVLAFQDSEDGEQLLPDSDQYEVIDPEKRIVKFCSIVERQGYLFIKVAKEDDNGSPTPLTDLQMARLTGYINRIKDAGVHFEVASRPADLFRVNVLIHYDAVMGLQEQTVKDAINAYLKSMPFDGVYSNMALTDALQMVPNIKVAQIRSAAAQYGDNQWQEIVSLYTPDAGYMALYEDLSFIELIPYSRAN